MFLAAPLGAFIEAKQPTDIDFHYEKVSAIHSLMMELQAQESMIDQSEYPSGTINSLYLKMAETVMTVSNRDLAGNCLLCLTDLFQRGPQRCP
jgi:hypothetical protein